MRDQNRVERFRLFFDRCEAGQQLALAQPGVHQDASALGAYEGRELPELLLASTQIFTMMPLRCFIVAHGCASGSGARTRACPVRTFANTKLAMEEQRSRRSHEYRMSLGPTTENENAGRSQECERGTQECVRYSHVPMKVLPSTKVLASAKVKVLRQFVSRARHRDKVRALA